MLRFFLVFSQPIFQVWHWLVNGIHRHGFQPPFGWRFLWNFWKSASYSRKFKLRDLFIHRNRGISRIKCLVWMDPNLNSDHSDHWKPWDYLLCFLVDQKLSSFYLSGLFQKRREIRIPEPFSPMRMTHGSCQGFELLLRVFRIIPGLVWPWFLLAHGPFFKSPNAWRIIPEVFLTPICKKPWNSPAIWKGVQSNNPILGGTKTNSPSLCSPRLQASSWEPILQVSK